MKIALVSKEFPPSRHSYGIGTYIEETALSLARLGHQVIVICSCDETIPAGESTREGVRIIRLPDDELKPTKIWRKFFPSRAVVDYRKRVAETLDKLIDAGQIDIVEFPGFRGESYLWHSERRVPMVVRMHGLTAWIDKSWRDRLTPRGIQITQYETTELLHADCITVPARHIRRAVEQRIPQEKIFTLHNGLNARQWMESARADTAPDVNGGDILYVGSLSKNKGIFDLVEASIQLHRRGIWAGRLILFGRTTVEFDRYYTRHLRRNGKALAFIHVRGQISRHRLPAAYRNAAICCFPSKSESFCYTALEATASGGLVVGAAGTGMTEFIIDGETGFLVLPGDVKALVAALEKALWLDIAQRERIRSVGQQRALAEFDQDQLTMRLVQVYENQIRQFRHNTAEAR